MFVHIKGPKKLGQTSILLKRRYKGTKCINRITYERNSVFAFHQIDVYFETLECRDVIMCVKRTYYLYSDYVYVQ